MARRRRPPESIVDDPFGTGLPDHLRPPVIVEEWVDLGSEPTAADLATASAPSPTAWALVAAYGRHRRARRDWAAAHDLEVRDLTTAYGALGRPRFRDYSGPLAARR